MEGAGILPIPKNNLTGVEMSEKYYAAHFKTNSTPPRSTSCGQSQRKRVDSVAGKLKCIFGFAACMIGDCKSPAMRAWRNGRR